MSQCKERQVIASRYPGLAKRAGGNGTKAAVKLHCIECAGTAADAKLCEVQDCFLWKHAFGRGSK